MLAKRRTLEWVVLLLVGSLALAPMNASAAVNGIKTGDFWEYGGNLGGPQFNGTGNITIRMTVAETLQESVGGVTEGVFRLNLSGGGDVKVSVPSLGALPGTVDIRGSMDRLQSNFSAARTSTMLDFELKVSSGGFELTVPLTIGLIASAAPALDDYIGDHMLAVGTKVISNSSFTTKSWFYSSLLGGNNTQNATVDESLALEITRGNVMVTVPAGTFSCWEVKVTANTSGSPNSTGYWYYSEKVGNYVQMKNSSFSMLSSLGGDLNLTAFSYGKGGAFTLSSPAGLALIVAVVAAAVVIVALAIRAARKKKAPPT